MPEFTGERLVPGQVDADLWNEHFSRYLFARRLARHKHVLDIGCGLGYGSAELAQVAAHVAGIDVSEEAVGIATESYRLPNLVFQAASAESIPYPDASFDLIVAFEVIEHLHNWDALLREARRLLSPGGQFIVSTPNRLYYAESRRLSGPNPYHVHEFDFEEFDSALSAHFPSVRMYLQNHVEAIGFQPLSDSHACGELHVEATPWQPATSHFFVAVCALSSQTGGPTFVHLPASSNVLREREHHIAKLEDELQTKDRWLEQLKGEHAELARLHALQNEEMARQSRWAMQLDQELSEAREILKARDRELEQLAGALTSTQDLLAQEKSSSAAISSELAGKVAELSAAVRLLDQAEKTVEERTLWAQQLQARIDSLQETMRAAGSSRWVRLGRKIGVGPALPAD